jgi:peptide deformylase
VMVSAHSPGLPMIRLSTRGTVLNGNFGMAKAYPSDASDQPSERMASIGIRQEGDPILRQTSRTFRLPEEAQEAESTIAKLIDTANRASRLHPFTKGIGLAAPQIGIPRAVAILWMPSHEPLVLLNPRVLIESNEND